MRAQVKSPSGPPDRRGAPGRRRAVVPIALLLVFCVAQASVRAARSRADAPTSAERIYATLVEWGADPSGLLPPVDDEEVERRIALLWSDDGETRVRAADWLASRGVRDAGDEIAASMADAGTLRPCQLAHSLGKLGDDRWVDALLAGARQQRNADLRACAAIALSHIASSRPVDALIQLTRDDPSRTFAVRSLGEAGDPRALDHLRWLRARATTETQRRVAGLAVERVQLLAQADPVPDLLERVGERLGAGEIDEWALRHLARRADARSVQPLARNLRDDARTRRHQELLAAALLAVGPRGRGALATLTRDAPEGARRAALAAISLAPGAGEAPAALASTIGR